MVTFKGFGVHRNRLPFEGRKPHLTIFRWVQSSQVAVGTHQGPVIVGAVDCHLEQDARRSSHGSRERFERTYFNTRVIRAEQLVWLAENISLAELLSEFVMLPHSLLGIQSNMRLGRKT